MLYFVQSLWAVLPILTHLCGRVVSTGNQFNIVSGEYTRILIPANGSSSLTVQNIDDSILFAVIQIHTQRQNVSISTEPTFESSITKTGTDIGITTLRKQGQLSLTWFAQQNGNQSIMAVVYVQTYVEDDPLPGGCNQVFELEMDPSIMVTACTYQTRVWFQWSNILGKTGRLLDCEDKRVKENLTYDVYVSYVPQRDFSETRFMDTIEGMLHTTDIIKNGFKVYSTKDTDSSKSLVTVTSQRNQGAVYAVVVTRLDTEKRAAYTSTVTYACDLEKQDCSADSSALEIIFAVALSICGLFLLCVGHRFFKLTQVTFGFAFASLLAYIIVSVPHTVEDSVKLTVAAAVGVIGGCLWLALWYLIGFPMISVLLQGMCAGYLVASALFFTPFGNIDWWTVDLNYGMAFAFVSFTFAVLLMNYVKLLSIVSCGIVGSFMFLMSMAIPLRSSLRLLFLNSVYHQTEKDYLSVQTVAPFFAQDIALTTIWPLLAIIGIIFQFYREHGRPAFESPVRNRTRDFHQISAPNSFEEDEDEQQNANGGQEVDDEKTRLVTRQMGARRGRPHSYQSTYEASPQFNNRNRERNLLA